MKKEEIDKLEKEVKKTQKLNGYLELFRAIQEQEEVKEVESDINNRNSPSDIRDYRNYIQGVR